MVDGAGLLFTSGMKVSNVVVVSRMGELLGIWWYRSRKVNVKQVD